MTKNRALPEVIIENKIYIIRGKKVMLDFDLAHLYGVETGALNRAIKRNIDRFPDDFTFQLTQKEVENLICQFGISNARPKNKVLISQIVISKERRGGRRKPISAFTEQGVAMLSSVLRSKRAIAVNIQIM